MSDQSLRRPLCHLLPSSHPPLTMTNTYERITLPLISPSTYLPPESPTLRTRAPVAIPESTVARFELHCEQPSFVIWIRPIIHSTSLEYPFLAKPHYSQCFASLLLPFQMITKHIGRPPPDYGACERERTLQELPLLRSRWPPNTMRSPFPLGYTIAQ